MTDRLDMLFDDEPEEDWEAAQAALWVRVQDWVWKPYRANQRAQMLMELVDIYLELARQIKGGPCRVDAHFNWTCCDRHLRQTSLMEALSAVVEVRLRRAGHPVPGTFTIGWWMKIEEFGIDIKGLASI